MADSTIGTASGQRPLTATIGTAPGQRPLTATRGTRRAGKAGTLASGRTRRLPSRRQHSPPTHWVDPCAAAQSCWTPRPQTAKQQILRREGLYTSHIIEWRKAAAAGAQAALGDKPADRRDKEIEALRARARRAEAELARTRAALDLVGKAHALLETLSESADTRPRSHM